MTIYITWQKFHRALKCPKCKTCNQLSINKMMVVRCSNCNRSFRFLEKIKFRDYWDKTNGLSRTKLKVEFKGNKKMAEEFKICERGNKAKCPKNKKIRRLGPNCEGCIYLRKHKYSDTYY